MSTQGGWEQCWKISELAAQWKVSREVIRLLFRNEPGVIKIRNGKKRAKATYVIPHSVAQRVWTKLQNSER